MRNQILLGIALLIVVASAGAALVFAVILS